MFQARAVWDGYFSTVNGLFSTIEKVQQVMFWSEENFRHKTKVQHMMLLSEILLENVQNWVVLLSLGLFPKRCQEKLLTSSPSPTNKSTRD